MWKPPRKACYSDKERVKRSQKMEKNKRKSKDFNDALFYSLVMGRFVLGFLVILSSLFEYGLEEDIFQNH